MASYLRPGIEGIAMGAAAAGNSYGAATSEPQQIRALEEVRSIVHQAIKDAIGIREESFKTRARLMGVFPEGGEQKEKSSPPNGQVGELRQDILDLHRIVCEIGYHVRVLETL